MTEEERPPEELSFEEAMESLDTIVGSLEGDRLPLEQMVSAYERGMKLLRVCRARIQTARQRVELITADLEGKSDAVLTPFAAQEAVEAPVLQILETVTAQAPPAEEAPKRSAKKKPAPEEQGEDEIRLF